MSGQKKFMPRTAWQVWSEHKIDDWRAAIIGLAWEGVPSERISTVAELDRLVRRLFTANGRPDQQLLFDLEAAKNSALSDAVAAGALLGFALARTWPGSPEGIAGWLRAARQYADLDGWFAVWAGEGESDDAV